MKCLGEGELFEIDSKGNNRMVGLAFKSLGNPKFGTMTYVKVFSGNLKKGSTLININKGVEEKIQKILRVQADDYKIVNEISTGDIAAVIGLTDTKSGDTLTDREEPNPKVLEGFDIPESVFLSSLDIDHTKDEKKLEEALGILNMEDPSFMSETDKETGQLVLRGLGELHLEIMKERILSEFKIKTNLSKIRVSYKESISSYSELHKETIQKMQGYIQFFELGISVEPIDLTDTSSFKKMDEGEISSKVLEKSVMIYLPFSNVIEISCLDDEMCAQFYNEYRTNRYKAESALDQSQHSNEYKKLFNTNKIESSPEMKEIGMDSSFVYNIKSIDFDLLYAMERIAINAFERGPTLGKKVLGTKINIESGKYTTDLTSKVMIESTTNKMILECLQNGSPYIMEPIMEVKITVMPDHTQKVINDFLGVRKGKIEEVIDAELTQDKRGMNTVLGFMSSQSSIGYANHLRSISKVSLASYFTG